MTTSISGDCSELTLAEAAAWLTRLQDLNRTATTEAAFKIWLDTSPAHSRAFARVNDVWELLPGAVASVNDTPVSRGHVRSRRVPGTHGRRPSGLRGRRRLSLVASVCAILLLAASITLHTMRHPSAHIYQTAIGEQRTILLADNTLITLNTDSKIAVTYREDQRHVQLERGEALFKVKKNPNRPFMVTTGDARIVDIGTTFDVRRDPQRVAVTLLEGKVEISTLATTSAGQATASALAPGERAIVDDDGTVVLDHPDVSEVLAWQHGETYFDNTTLDAAVTELNRYGAPRLQLADPALASLRVSGVFSVHNHAQFATAVASLHNLRVARVGSAIVLQR